MTTVAVLVEDSSKRTLLSDLVERNVLSRGETGDLFEAMVRDVIGTVDRSGGEVVVAARTDDVDLGGTDPHGETDESLRHRFGEAVEGELEVEVSGESDRASWIEAVLRSLLDRPGVETAAVVPASVPMLERTHVDGAAMRLRRSSMVLGPDHRGGTFYVGTDGSAAFGGGLDPSVEVSLVREARRRGSEVDFLPVVPTVRGGRDLRWLVGHVEALRAAGRRVPARTAAWIDGVGATMTDEGTLEFGNQ